MTDDDTLTQIGVSALFAFGFCMLIFAYRKARRSWLYPQKASLLVVTATSDESATFLDKLSDAVGNRLGEYIYESHVGTINSNSQLLGDIAVILAQSTTTRVEIEKIVKRMPTRIAIHVVGMNTTDASVSDSFTIDTHAVRCWQSITPIVPLAMKLAEDLGKREKELDLTYEKPSDTQV